jgi:hypothetical protein
LRRAAGYPKFERGRNVRVVNQLHPDGLVLDVVKPDMLLMPTAKAVGAAPPPLAIPPVGSFTCYRVKRGPFRAEGLKVEDQFFPSTLGPDTGRPLTASIKRPYRLCLATRVDGGSGIEPPTHLLCYKTKTDPRRVDVGGIGTESALGAWTIRSTNTRELCVPTAVNAACGNGVVEPTFEECDGTAGGSCAGPCRPAGEPGACTCGP